MPTFSFFVSDSEASNSQPSSSDNSPTITPRKLRQLRIASKILAYEIEYNRLRKANKPQHEERIAELEENLTRFRQLYDDLSTPENIPEPETPQQNRDVPKQQELDTLQDSGLLPVVPFPLQLTPTFDHPVNNPIEPLHLDIDENLEIDPLDIILNDLLRLAIAELPNRNADLLPALAEDSSDDDDSLADDFYILFDNNNNTTGNTGSSDDEPGLLGFLPNIQLDSDSDTDDDNMPPVTLTTRLLQDLRRSHEDNAQALIDGLSNLNARALMSEIPSFSGDSDQGQVIEEWFKTAERVANAAGWTHRQKLNFFQQKLIKSAANFNDSLTPAQKVDYPTWKQEIINGLQDTTAKAIRKEQLKHLKQLPNERVRDFKIRIDDNYKIAYGFGAATSNDPHVEALRDDIKKDVLLKGLKPEVSTLVWSRIHPDETYLNAADVAIACEKLSEVQKISANQDLTSVVTVISKENEKNAEEIKDLKDLVQELVKTTISPKPIAGIESMNDPAVIAAFNKFYSSNQGRGRVRFSDTNRNRFTGRSSGYQTDNYYNSGNRSSRHWDKRCYNCNKSGHIARQCRRQRMQPYNRQRNRSTERGAQSKSKE